MIISLIGMSNSGKTFWARKLESAGFQRYSCDDLIEKKLDKELKKSGFLGIHDVAKWMGQPYEKRYQTTSRKYLEFEKVSLLEIFDKIKNDKLNRNVVVDTTGSVIYTGEDIMESLRRLTTVVYLDTPFRMKQQMCELYFANPKPVIWGDKFQKQNGETDMETLRFCYPLLLEYRCRQYKKHANIRLDYFLLRQSGFSSDDFLKLVPS